AWLLHLDDFGAMIRHGQGQIGPRQKVAQVDDSVALKFHDRRSLSAIAPTTASVSLPSGEQLRSSGRCPSNLSGLDSTRRSSLSGCLTVEIMPFCRTNSLFSVSRRSRTGATGNTPCSRASQ